MVIMVTEVVMMVGKRRRMVRDEKRIRFIFVNEDGFDGGLEGGETVLADAGVPEAKVVGEERMREGLVSTRSTKQVATEAAMMTTTQETESSFAVMTFVGRTVRDPVRLEIEMEAASDEEVHVDLDGLWTS